MHEMERPYAERLSVFDRWPIDSDIDSERSPSFLRFLGRCETKSVRLCVRADPGSVYLGRDLHRADDVAIHYVRSGGGGAGLGHPRAALRERGISSALWMSGASPEVVLYGAAVDDVERIAVDGIEATIRDNAYLVQLERYPELIEVSRDTTTWSYAVPLRGDRPAEPDSSIVQLRQR
jgi:hypothetical protein